MSDVFDECDVFTVVGGAPYFLIIGSFLFLFLFILALVTVKKRKKKMLSSPCAFFVLCIIPQSGGDKPYDATCV